MRFKIGDRVRFNRPSLRGFIGVIKDIRFDEVYKVRFDKLGITINVTDADMTALQ